MAYEIPVPTDDKTYSLVSDLSLMASTISSYLVGLSDRINGKPEEGASAGFTSISVSGTGQFGQVTVNGPIAGSIINSAGGFGLFTGGLSLLSGSSKWNSSGQIAVPNGGFTTDTTNFNDVAAALTPLLNRITSLESMIGTLGNTYVTRTDFNASQNAQNVEINHNYKEVLQSLSGKVNNYGGDTSKAQKAHIADSSLETTGLAQDTVKVIGRLVEVGRFNAGTISPGAYKNTSIKFHKQRPAGFTSTVFAQATSDDGNISIICSVDNITRDGFTIRYKNLTTSSSEATYINWLAI